jgi:hypothetical protein
MSDDAWVTAFADHLARCGGDASVYTAHSWLVTALGEIISEVLTYLTMLVQIPNGNDGLPADVGVLHYHGIRGSKLAPDAVVSGLFGVSSPPSPEVAMRRAEKLLASWRRKVSLAVHVPHADNVLRGLSAAADGVEAASSSDGMPFLATALFTRAMGRKRPRASSSGA